MRIPLLYCALLSLSLPLTSFCSDSHTPDILTPEQALQKKGSIVTVEFKVKGDGHNPAGYAELYSEKMWNDPHAFYVRFTEKVQERMRRLKILDLGAHFMNETIRATGEMQMLSFTDVPGSWGSVVIDDLDHFETVVPQFVPTEKYEKKQILGWEVLLSPEMSQHVKERDQALEELQSQLGNVKRVLTEKQLAAVLPVRFWFEWENLTLPSAAAYHGNAGWVKVMGYNPEKAGGIEISNTRHFIDWSRSAQPWMIMHELAHAYHFRVLGENYPGILKAYANAIENKLYDAVPYLQAGGKLQKAYATTNDKEYFAECTEAWFGKNDFYPFVRPELQKHDPLGYELMKTVWGERSEARSEQK